MTKNLGRFGSLKNNLLDVFCEMLYVVGATFLIAISIFVCEVIVTYVIKGVEFVTGHHLPEWLHNAITIVFCIVLLTWSISIAHWHVKGMKFKPESDEKETTESEKKAQE
jgi:hypothetical protein